MRVHPRPADGATDPGGIVTADHSTLAAALVAALAELTTVTKGRNAQIDSKKGGASYSYTYADLGDLVMDTRPVLAAHGLVALTPVHGHDGRLACTVELIHTSGESKSFAPLPFPEGNDARSTGSWMTYFRRYALLAALGMATSDDDGAEATSGSRAPAYRAPTAPAFDPADQSTWPLKLTAGQAKSALVAHHCGDTDAAAAMWAQLDVPSTISKHWLATTITRDQADQDAGVVADLSAYDEQVPS